MSLDPSNHDNLDTLRQWLYSAVVSDVLDALGFPNQSPAVQLRPLTGFLKLLGRCKTTLWTDMAHRDPKPYEMELAAVDALGKDDVLIAAAGSSMRSGIWGELLSTAARNRGCAGAIVDGAVRDVAKMREMNFVVFACGTSARDSLHRQRVVDIDVNVEIGGVLFCPGDLVVADEDGVVVVPRAVEQEALAHAWRKVTAENRVRQAIGAGMKAVEAYRQFGIL